PTLYTLSLHDALPILRFHTDALDRRVNDDGPHARVVSDPQFQIGPPQGGRALGPHVHVIEPAVAQRWTRTEILAFADLANLTGRDRKSTRLNSSHVSI